MLIAAKMILADAKIIFVAAEMILAAAMIARSGEKSWFLVNVCSDRVLCQDSSAGKNGRAGASGRGRGGVKSSARPPHCGACIPTRLPKT